VRVEAHKCDGCGRMLVGVRRVALMVDAHPRVELDLCGACTVDAVDTLLKVEYSRAAPVHGCTW
jgi:ferredoxin